MISQSLRTMVLVALVIFAVTAPLTTINTATLHHQPAPCGPDC
jgi:hypothetical protein